MGGPSPYLTYCPHLWSSLRRCSRGCSCSVPGGGRRCRGGRSRWAGRRTGPPLYPGSAAPPTPCDRCTPPPRTRPARSSWGPGSPLQYKNCSKEVDTVSLYPALWYKAVRFIKRQTKVRTIHSFTNIQAGDQKAIFLTKSGRELEYIRSLPV